MLIVIRLRKKWLTIETGQVGDDNDPQIDREEKEEKPQPKFKLGFGTEINDS